MVHHCRLLDLPDDFRTVGLFVVVGRNVFTTFVGVAVGNEVGLFVLEIDGELESSVDGILDGRLVG